MSSTNVLSPIFFSFSSTSFLGFGFDEKMGRRKLFRFPKSLLLSNARRSGRSNRLNFLKTILGLPLSSNLDELSINSGLLVVSSSWKSLGVNLFLDALDTLKDLDVSFTPEVCSLMESLILLLKLLPLFLLELGRKLPSSLPSRLTGLDRLLLRLLCSSSSSSSFPMSKRD